jgi:Flp pilus assembly protein TadG
MVRSYVSRRGRRHAAAAVEFAFTLPILVVFILGIWELGRMIQIYQVVANAAREGVRQAASAKYTNTQVQQDVLQYLLYNGVPMSDTLPNSSVTLANTNATITVTVANSTNNALGAAQFTPMTVTVQVPVKNFRWTASSYFAPDSITVQGTASFLCLADVPVSVTTTIPEAPLP